MKSRVSLAHQFGDPYGTLVKAGEYRCFFRGVEKGFYQGSERLFCWFTISPDQDGGDKPLLRVYNALRKPFVPRSHNIHRDYWALTGLRPGPTVKPADYLKDCEVLAQVVTVHEDQKLRRGVTPSGPPYSKIDGLIKITAGTPPCLIRRGASQSEPDLELEPEQEHKPEQQRQQGKV
jgi:hypothetical protein